MHTHTHAHAHARARARVRIRGWYGRGQAGVLARWSTGVLAHWPAGARARWVDGGVGRFVAQAQAKSQGHARDYVVGVTIKPSGDCCSWHQTMVIEFQL